MKKPGASRYGSSRNPSLRENYSIYLDVTARRIKRIICLSTPRACQSEAQNNRTRARFKSIREGVEPVFFVSAHDRKIGNGKNEGLVVLVDFQPDLPAVANAEKKPSRIRGDTAQ